MKIIQVVPLFGMGGAEVMCENLIYELRKRGHEIIVISMYDYHSVITERLEQADIDIRYLNKKSGLDVSVIGKMWKIFSKEKADVVHTHLYCTKYAMPAALLAGINSRVHTIHTVARKELGAASRKFNWFLFKFCRVVPVALSSAVQETIISEYDLPPKEVPVVCNGVDLSRCRPKESYCVNGTFKIVHIGRFCEPKNHCGLLNAFRIFHEKHPDSELWLIGDGDGRPDAELFVQNNALESAVKFLGCQSDVFQYLHQADIFTLPSNYEGIPLALIEAMGTGLPIVATNVGGIPDMLDAESSLMVPVNTDAIAAAFEQYYEDSNLRQQHGKRARGCSYKFGAAIMAENYERIYLRSNNQEGKNEAWSTNK